MRAHLPAVTRGSSAGAGGRVPFFKPRIHMVSRESTSVRPRPNHSLKDLDTGFSSSWPQANVRYPAHAWRKASMTACWRSLGEAAGEAVRGTGPGQGGQSLWGPQAGKLRSRGALSRATGQQHEGRGTARVRPSELDRAVEVERRWGLTRQLGLMSTRPVPSTCRATGSPGEQSISGRRPVTLAALATWARERPS